MTYVSPIKKLITEEHVDFFELLVCYVVVSCSSLNVELNIILMWIIV
jgi:hypothetical protein